MSHVRRINSFANIASPQVLPSTPTSESSSECGFQTKQGNHAHCFVIVMVGLPARGKSFSARQLSKYLNWLNIDCRIFNAGEKRRQVLGAGQSSHFWDSDNRDGQEQRKRIGMATLQELIDWLMQSENQNSNQSKLGAGNTAEEYSSRREIKCAIFDATNTTRERRQMIIQHLTDENLPNHLDLSRIIFVELICNEQKIIENNVRDIKIKSSDYKGVASDEAVKDFMMRIKAYEQVYETICDEFEGGLSYIKMIDVGNKFILNRIGGYVPTKINQCLMNLHLSSHSIWLSRHGESHDNTLGLLGGDSDLTERGQAYAKVLFRFTKRMQEERRKEEISIERPCLDNMMVWTSLLRRTQQTSHHFKMDGDFKIMRWRCLNELDAGVCEGMTYERVEKEMPHEFHARESDKFRYRPQNGESYLDLIYRIEPAILELERQRCPLLIIGHQAVNRILYSYLTGQRPENCTRLPIPLNTVIEIIPNAYGFEEHRYDLNAEVQKEYEEMIKNK